MDWVVYVAASRKARAGGSESSGLSHELAHGCLIRDVGGVAYLLFTILISPVTMFLMANEVEKMYVDAGEEPRITTIWGLWFLLPLIGNIIWYVRIQNAINEFWQARGGTTSPGLI
jgi:hypothetical protein